MHKCESMAIFRAGSFTHIKHDEARVVAGRNLTPPRDGLVAIQIAQAAAESMRSGRTIDLDETLQPTGLP